MTKSLSCNVRPIGDAVKIRATKVLEYAADNKMTHADSTQHLYPKASADQKIAIVEMALTIYLMDKVRRAREYIATKGNKP